MSCVLHLRCSRGFYGAERVILDLARGCTAQGVPSAIACVVDGREPHVELVVAARQAKVDAFELQSRGRFDLRPLVELLRLLDRLKPAVLHLHGYKALALGCLARLARPVPLVATHHGDTAQSTAVRAYEALGRKLLARCDRVIAVSAEGERALRARLPRPDRLRHIPNGVDAADIAARMRAAPDLRPQLDLNGAAVVLAVGRLSPEKGHATLLQAVSRLPGPKPVVVLAGEGPLRDDLAVEAQRRGVRLLLIGYQQDLAPWWRLADVLCQPSLREGLPIAVLEGMAAGLPVVASAVGELPDVLGGALAAGAPDAEGGLLVQPGEPDALSRALARLLDPAAAGAELRRRAGEGARQRAERRYGLPALVRRTIDEVYLPLAPRLVHDDDQPTGRAPIPGPGPGRSRDRLRGASR